jgi:hypothetical protein
MDPGMMRQAAGLLGCVGTALLLATGCDPTANPFAPVHGKVSYRGSPLRAGTIIFSPDTAHGCRGSLVQAEIQSDGAYELRTAGAPGAMAGWYRITVAATAKPSGSSSRETFTDPYSLVPDKYRDPELSGLVREVKSPRPNRFDFDLD